MKKNMQNKNHNHFVWNLIFKLNLILLAALPIANVAVAQTDPDDVIFINSFEVIDFGTITFLTDRNTAFDQADATIRVRATRGNGRLLGLTVNGVPARAVQQNETFVEFVVDLTLTSGVNELSAVGDYGTEVIEELSSVRFVPLNELQFTYPIDWQTLGAVGGAGGALNQTGVVERPVNITGTLSATVVDVTINQQQAEFDGDSFWFDDFFLREGTNLLTATTTDEFGRKNSTSITVYVDQTAPFIMAKNLSQRVTSANFIDLTGTVNDAVEGDFNAPNIEVEIEHLITGAMYSAEVAEINYLAPGVKLVLGPNPMAIRATDAFDNSREILVDVTRVAVGSDRLTYLSGNHQTGDFNTALSNPLRVVAFDRNGLPISGVPISFDYAKGSGTLRLDPLQPVLHDGVNTSRNITVLTNESGEAEVWLVPGIESGFANQIVKASSSELSEDVYFMASTRTGNPSRILIEDGSATQYAQTNSQPIHALTSRVLDEHSNPIANQLVRYTILEGDAVFTPASAPAGVVLNNGKVIHTFTDKKGQASVRPLLGSTAGTIQILAQAEVGSDDYIGATTFQVISQKRTDQPTAFSGVVMDHTGTPIEGVQLSIGRTSLNTLTDATGEFQFSGIAAHGKIDLFVDGRGIQAMQNGETIEYPALHFETALVQGQNNQLPHVIYLPPIHLDRTQTVGGAEDVTLTIPGFEGFKMVVKANSVTFPDGSSSGELVVNPVHNDRLPMVPPGGSGRFSPFGWTLQPTGTRFDPPIEVHIPNVDGFAPGSSTPIVQWDHDLAQFVPMGLGIVSEDGLTIVSEPGSGITYAGWGGAPNPPPTNEPENPKDDSNRPYPDPNDPSNDDDSDESDQNPNTDADPVIIGTGELITSVTDLQIKGRGFDFEFTRTYRSKFTYNGPLGQNWNHNHNDMLDIQTGQVRYARGDGRMDTFVENTDGSYATPAGLYLRLLAQSDGTFILRDRHGFQSFFNSNGQLTERVDRLGNRMSYRYDDRSRLQEITDTLGRKIRLAYYQSNRLRSVTDFTDRQVQYEYDGNNDLVSVRSPVVIGTSIDNDFPFGQITKYTYSSGFTDEELNHNLLTITDAKDQTYLVNTYGEVGYQFDKILTQQEGEQNQSYEFSYIDLPGGSATEPNVPDNQVTITDRAGNIEIHIHNARGNLLEKRELTNRNVNPLDDDEYVIRHAFDQNGEITETTYPEGNRLQYVFDSTSVDPLRRGNLLSVTEIAGPRGASQATLKKQLQYEPVYNQIMQVIDPRAFAAEFIPPNGGAANEARYQTIYQFDYQEASNLTQLATLMGVSTGVLTSLLDEVNMSLNQGDLNNDALTTQTVGNKVRKIMPSPRLIGGSTQTVLTEYQYNRFGQIKAAIDPEGHVNSYRYFAEVNPAGNGVFSDSDRLLATDTGGYLRKHVRDDAFSPRRGNLPLERVSNSMRYNTVGQVTSMTDGRQNTTQFERNTLDRVIKITSTAPFSYVHEIHYDANNNVIRREVENRDTNGPGLDQSVTTTYQYNILNQPTIRREEVAAGQFITNQLSYDANENITGLVFGEGNRIARVIDERDLVYAVTKGAGSAEASTTYNTYDGNQNLIRLRDAQDNNGDGIAEIIELSYDGYDRMIQRRDAVGNLTQLSYDPVNNVTLQQQWGPRGGPSPLNNSGTNNELLAETGFLYDELNRLYQLDLLFQDETGSPAQDGSLTPNDGLVTYQFGYDRSSRLTARTDDNSHQTIYAYDGVNRRTQITDALGNVKAYQYDQNSNLTQINTLEIDPAGMFAADNYQWQIEYDELNRTTKVIDNLSNTTLSSYDSRNNLIEKTDPLNNVSTYIYDGQDRLLQTTKHLSVDGAGGVLDTSNPDNPDGLINEWITYDDNSRITALIDDNNSSTAYSYDELNRLSRKTWPDESFEQYLYDDDHNMTQLIDPSGSVHDIAYDGINRLINVDITRAAGVIGTDNLNYQYDGLNRRTRLEDNNNPLDVTDDWVLEVGFDSLNHSTVQNQNGQIVASVFDGVGNQSNLTYPSGRVVERSYDALDRVIGINENSDQSLIAAYSYMGKARVVERNHGNGTLWRMHDGTEMTGYDELKRVVNMEHLDANGTLISAFEYGYDAAGNRRFESEQIDALVPAISKLFELDSSYRAQRSLTNTSQALTALTNNNITNADLQNFDQGLNKSYRMDGVGNWRNLTESGTASSSTDYVVNELNQYEQIGADAQAYDADGNLTLDGDRILRYDALDRLVEVEELGSIVASFSYDALSRRVSKTSNTGTTFYFHDRNEVIEEQDAAEQVLRTYVQGRYLDEMIQMQTPQDTFYYHSSTQLSIAAVTNQAGEVVERYRYGDFGQTEIMDALGNVLNQSAIGNTFGYTGRRMDPETGYYYYRARYYDPRRGRFLNRDPIGYVAGMNLYTYVLNNPLNWIDPFGFEQSWADEAREAFDDYVDGEIEEGACDGSWGGSFSCAALAIEKALFEVFVADVIEVAQDLYDGEISLQTAIDLGLVVCKICKAGDKLGDAANKGCSFEGDTPVLTSEGYKPISEVQIGDYVWSKDEDNSGEWMWRPVTAVFNDPHTDLIELIVVDDAGNTSTITTTSEHPFYSDGEWSRADQLQAGMWLNTANTDLKISTVSWLDTQLTAYNMTVGQSHTYTVGEEQVWVHNACTYRVPGERTESGKPYIGMTKKDDPSLRPGNGKDGRDREAGDITTDLGDNPDRLDLRIQEQTEMNAAGGLDNLDNKINSIKESDWAQHNIPPPDGG